MNKLTVIIISALILLGVAHYIESMESVIEDCDHMKPTAYPEIEAGKTYFVGEVDNEFVIKEVIGYVNGSPIFGEPMYPNVKGAE